MPTVVDTVGAANANSYLSVANATTILDERLGASAWTDADLADQGRALIMATRDIDSLRISGRRYTSTQALMFPNSVQIEPADEIPLDVQRACAEQALWLLQNSGTGGRSERQQLQAQGVSSYTIGNLSETFSGGAGASSQFGNLCSEAQRFLQGYVSRTGRLIGPRETPLYEQGRGGWTTGPFAPWP